MEEFFKGAPKTVVPWPQAGRLKGERYLLDEDIERLSSTPPRLREVDPSTLHATQTWVLAEHARYYESGEWEISGRTSADMDQQLNRFPLLLARKGKLVILTGHHRSLAALLDERPLLARIVVDDQSGPFAVTPHVLMDPSSVEQRSADERAAGLRSGQQVCVQSIDDAALLLECVGLSEVEIADRLRLFHGGILSEPADERAASDVDG